MDIKSCLTQQIFTELCPRCKSSQNVWLGHGNTRHCTDCIISWGEELVWLESSAKAAELELPRSVRMNIRDTEKDLGAASDLDSRLKKLRAITDEEWEQAVNEG